jgi:hypothetical protein
MSSQRKESFMSKLRPLQNDEIAVLAANGCTAQSWDAVTVREGFDPRRVRSCAFQGRVEIGSLRGTVKSPEGLPRECGLFNALLADVRIGNECRLASIGVHIAHYDIENGVSIENVGTMDARSGATFGNGIGAEVLNEGGGREVILFNELSAQFAYLLCLHRYRPLLIEKLTAIAQRCAERARRDRGFIGPGATIRSVTELIDMCIGAEATIDGASSLRNGTILSAPDARTHVGAGVCAKDFIIAEGAAVTDGAILSRTFIGQGCRIGKQYSAENSLFFANSEGFHGEACSVFAGPYTVTHHKSTLLIAGLFSFYNAGSGTNQSNHLYKLGPVHEGKLGRGTKTGSFSYMMWPCRVGPFSVVLGKNMGTFDTAEFPFSHLEARPDGKTVMIPGLNVVTVGTVRDGAKWRSRDRRTGAVKRDAITFDVFSPYVVGQMRRARKELERLQRETDKSIEEVSVGGAMVRRPILRTGQKYYRNGIEMYLYEKAFERAEKAAGAGGGIEGIRAAFAALSDAAPSDRWADIGGLLMAEGRLRAIEDAIEAGTIADLPGFFAAIEAAAAAYEGDAWTWVKAAFTDEFGIDLDRVSREDIMAIADTYLAAKSKFFTLILADAQKEFDPVSRTGFGQDGSAADVDKDFAGVRGAYEKNKFVKEMQAQRAALEQRVAAFKTRVVGLP